MSTDDLLVRLGERSTPTECPHCGSPAKGDLHSVDAECGQFGRYQGQPVGEWYWGPPSVSCLNYQLAAAKADNARLQAIVDRLPKTADGVPVTPRMVLYRHDPSFVPGDRDFECVVGGMDHNCTTFLYGEDEGYDKWYSTREAAEEKPGG